MKVLVKNLRKKQHIKDYSDKLCLEIGASVIPKKEKTNYIKRNYKIHKKSY